MKIHAIRQEGYELLQRGCEELARVEGNGIRVDMDHLANTKEELQKKIRRLRKELESSEVWKIWKRRYGGKANLTSREQLGTVLHEEMDFEVGATTGTGRPQMDEEALQKIDHPFVVDFLRVMKYEKALGTYLKGIEKEVVDGRLHPFFNLHTVRTYRSSSDSPNFQNLPVRDKDIARIIRTQFIASPKSVLVERDFKGIEVGVAACYHKDPNFISYITTPGKDMHRDMAAQLYCLKPEEVSKDARYGAKNKFVFPQFYGDFYVSCARALWDWIEKGKLKGPDGKSLYRHLKKHSIHVRGECDPDISPPSDSFERHVRDVENDFWNNRFQKYGEWRKKWYQRYLEKGHFDLKTGFRVYGSFPRNSVTNYPIQGSAFHCLLWSLIRINRIMRKHKMKSMIVGQIHDSLIGDIRVDELQDYLEIVDQVTTVDLRKHWSWIIVPLEVECEISPPRGSWFEKREIKFKDGKFYHPEKPDKFTRDASKFLKIIGRKNNGKL